MDRLLEGIGSFLQKRLRGTDRVEWGPRGEFRLSVHNVDSNCLPSLQRRFSPMMLACQGAALPDEMDEGGYSAPWELAHRR
jgi:hypothetical protein